MVQFLDVRRFPYRLCVLCIVAFLHMQNRAPVREGWSSREFTGFLLDRLIFENGAPVREWCNSWMCVAFRKGCVYCASWHFELPCGRGGVHGSSLGASPRGFGAPGCFIFLLLDEGSLRQKREWDHPHPCVTPSSLPLGRHRVNVFLVVLKRFESF